MSQTETSTSTAFSQQGNVLFLILIAVALFAALSYTISQSMQASPGKTAREQMNLNVSQLFQYVAGIEQAVQRMKFSGIQEEQISFHHTLWGHNDYQHTSGQPMLHQIFQPQGGGVSLHPPPKDLNDGTMWQITGHLEVVDVGMTCGSPVCAELILVLPNIKPTACALINDYMGVQTLPDTVPLTAIETRFTGTFGADGVIGDEGGALRSVPSGCFEGGGGAGAPAGTYHFYHVLIPR